MGKVARMPTRTAVDQPADFALNTSFLLMAHYGARPIIPVDEICRDFFKHLSPENFVRKVSAGELALPLVRMDAGPKCAKGVALVDLAAYLDRQMEAARREAKALCG
jgi:hypothetical protein